MSKPLALLSMLPLLVGPTGAAGATFASQGYTLNLSVPVLCTLRHHPALAQVGNGYSLGELREFCNAPAGYVVTVTYAPGTMRGALVMVGDEQVTLDGSGQSVVSRALGPKIREREIVTRPGAQGFDTDRLDFAIASN